MPGIPSFLLVYYVSVRVRKQRAGETVWVFVCACMYMSVCVRACVHLLHGKKSAQFST